MVWNVDHRTARSSPTRPADSGTFFWAPFRNFFFCKLFVAFAGNAKSGFEPTKFVAFPGNVANFVGSAGSTLFAEFPGNAAKNLQKKVPEWGPEKSSGTCRPGWGFRAPGWGVGAKFGPDLIFKSGPKHQKWPEMGPESTVRPENRSP